MNAVSCTMPLQISRSSILYFALRPVFSLLLLCEHFCVEVKGYPLDDEVQRSEVGPNNRND